MDKLILFLEDNDSLCDHTVELLRDSGYTVEDFSRIDQAKEYFSDHKDEIACIVTDLNMSDEWLENYSNESFGNILSGWVWLNHFVLPLKSDIPIVIYSGFLNELGANIPSEQWQRRTIELVSKGSDDNEGFDGLLKAIEKVIKKGQHNNER